MNTATELEEMGSKIYKVKSEDRDHTIRLDTNDFIKVPQPLPPAPGLIPNPTENIINVDELESISEIPEQLRNNELMTMSNPPKNKWRVYALGLWLFSIGMADATPGAVLPYIEEYYNLTYTLVSLIWMTFAAGFVSFACLAHKIQPLLGREKSFTVGSACSVLMYAIVSSGTKFPVICVGFFFGGAGYAVVISQMNVFLTNFQNSSKYLSVTQSLYGVGATISPLIATSFVSAGIKWNLYYVILVGLMAITSVVLYISFKGADTDLAPWDFDENDLENEKSETPTELLLLSLKSKITWLLAFFVFFYQGSEVALGGWIVTYLLNYRHGTHNVGYVASGFWAGLTLGRLCVARPMHNMFGLRRSVIICSVISTIAVVLTWVVPNIIAAGVFVSISGVFIGPNYPLMVAYSALKGLIPRKILIITLTVVTAFGFSGGAIFPFLVGVISQKAGTYVVLPMFIALYLSMLILWLLVPNQERILKQSTLTFWQKVW
ncbi:bypass of stop codon protein 6 [[Candida] jaroonii]|uniref:Bypass of stop codon protein 6 n=1 Tax=[Candida] jaroonii TaxID=467808 RepID=A0ACA9YG09_9ASCO|nr:bypass of stop codon protein 6 [[Candida] jaroonii]